MKLQGKAAIVTGAGFGMGRAIAMAFAREGAGVLAADINRANAEGVVEEIRALGGEAAAAEADVTRSTDVERMVAECLEHFGAVDILVNNVGVRRVKPFLEHTEEDWREMIDINLTSQFLCAKAVVPHMLERGGGKIVNLASVASYVGRPNRVAYCAAKGGVLQFTRALATDMKGMNIHVNAIIPGSIASGMNADPASDPAVDWGGETLLERWGQPEDVANVAVFLACGDSDYVTGADIKVDGGWLAGRSRDGET